MNLPPHTCLHDDEIEYHNQAVRELRTGYEEHETAFGSVMRELGGLVRLVGRPPRVDENGNEHAATGLYAAVARRADAELATYQSSIPPEASPDVTGMFQLPVQRRINSARRQRNVGIPLAALASAVVTAAATSGVIPALFRWLAHLLGG